MRVLALHHVPHQPQALQRWAEISNQQVDFIDCANAQGFPEPQIYDAFIIMGGPMSVNDPFPWLSKEITYIQHLVTINKPVLGICLGAQLIAKALGADVRRMAEHEIGWHPVQRVTGSYQATNQWLPLEFVPLHWHSDHFDLPEDAVHLYKSEACKNQAFAFGKHILGLQFHLDFDVCTTTRIAGVSKRQLRESGPFIQQLDEMIACTKRFDTTNQLLFDLLDNFFQQ